MLIYLFTKIENQSMFVFRRGRSTEHFFKATVAFMSQENVPDGFLPLCRSHWMWTVQLLPPAAGLDTHEWV